jgi:hypothetical protein|tara:strand:- start:2720 stop:2926 length:207 start_codon:yes stop_codon:yes gene_type:complete
MKFRALKEFSSVRWGNVCVGDLVELDGDIAKKMVDLGYMELPQQTAIALRQEPEKVEPKKGILSKAKK